VRRLVAGLGITAAAAVGLAAPSPIPPPRDAASEPARDPYSNVRAVDYVGPDACGDCHDDNHTSWQDSLHAVMNQPADAGGVLGDFSGVEVRYAGGVAWFGADGDQPMIELRRAGTTRRYRVTRTIGSRYLQEYVGVQTVGPEPPGDPIYDTEIRLPFGWWVRGRGWFHQQYFDSWYGREHDAQGEPVVDAFDPDPSPWAARCAWCHNTYPFELRIVRADAAPIGVGLEQHVEPIAPWWTAAERDAIAAQNLLPVDRLVTVGISCESCHLGGRDHAERDAPIRFAPTSPDLRRAAGAPDLDGGRHSPTVVNGICAQCHSTPAARYPHGGVTRNSSEALDLTAGACAPAIACTDCHDPHVAGPGPGGPDSPRHLAACAGCHGDLADPVSARAHARHDPGDASCLDCHMPRIVQGVSDVVRSHRISSPSDAAMLAAGAPNACNLCHLDRSIGWTVRAIEDGWGRRLAIDDAWLRSYPRLDAPVGDHWIAGADRSARIAAAAAYARSPFGARALAQLIWRLDDPIAYDRMWMVFAIEAILDRPLSRGEYDPTAPPARRAAQVRRLARALGPAPAPAPAR
jgi:hypothetical protein